MFEVTSQRYPIPLAIQIQVNDRTQFPEYSKTAVLFFLSLQVLFISLGLCKISVFELFLSDCFTLYIV